MCQSGIEKKDLSKLFRSTEELKVPEESEIDGELPKWVNGTILRVGPGLFDLSQDFSMCHYLDGYAVLSKFEISNKSVKFHKRFLQSDAFKRAVRSKQAIVCEFGTKAYPEKGKGLIARFMSAIMPEMSDNNQSNIFRLGNDFFASNDGNFIRKFDTTSLETGERLDCNKLLGLNGWTSHPLTDIDGDTYNIGFSILSGLKFSVIKICQTLASQSPKDAIKSAKILCSISSSYHGGLSFVHSFGMTDKFLIFIEQPYIASASKIAVALIKGSSVKEWMEWKPHLKNRFHIIEKSSGKVLKTEYVSEPFFFLHFVNCFEKHNENKLVVDIVALDDPGILDGMFLSKLRNNIVEKVSQPTFRRFVIPIISDENRHNQKIILKSDIITPDGCEMPCINSDFKGKNYSYFYVSGTIAQNIFSHSISKVDLHSKKIVSWKGSEHFYPGEPIFVSNPKTDQEDDGIIMASVSDVEKDHKDFLIFIDAKTMKEIARSSFNAHVPGALHGLFFNSKK